MLAKLPYLNVRISNYGELFSCNHVHYHLDRRRGSIENALLYPSHPSLRESHMKHPSLLTMDNKHLSFHLFARSKISLISTTSSKKLSHARVLFDSLILHS